MQPKILIVEDSLDQAEDIARFVREIPEEMAKACRVTGFEINKAHWETQALKLLRKAKDAGKPYDVMFLDLALPHAEGDRPDDPEVGLAILRQAREWQAVTETVAVSAFGAPEWILKAYESGVSSFVAKPYKRERIQPRLAESLDKVFQWRTAQIREQRIRTLAPHSERMLAYRFGLCFSGLVQRMARAVEDLRSDLQDRFGIDLQQQPDDPFALHLEDVLKAISEARAGWLKIQGPSEPEQPKALNLEDLLSQVESTLEPCLIVNNARIELPRGGPTQVLSFSEDVRVVLQEIFLGALIEPPKKRTKPITFSVRLEGDGETVDAIVEDDADQIESETAESISAGKRISADEQFSRSWGLSVAQDIAQRGGGRLHVEQARGGTLIRYQIPRPHA
jgi:CheY-like chemotaxis protein